MSICDVIYIYTIASAFVYAILVRSFFFQCVNELGKSIIIAKR